MDCADLVSCLGWVVSEPKVHSHEKSSVIKSSLFQAHGDSTFCVPAAPAPAREPKLSLGSRIARPAGSGIPRPGGSRLPTPRVSSGIPKPSGRYVHYHRKGFLTL